MNNHTDKKIALVTGASRGIGEGIAYALAEAGYLVIGTATTNEGAEKISAALNAFSGKGYVADVSSIDSIHALIQNIKESHGGISILVNNAGVTQDNLILRMKEEEWIKVLETDLTSVYRLTKLCIKNMLKARWGRIINIGSVVALTGNPGQANYCAAKAGIIGFSKAVALEVGSRNITINTVAPGYIETDMTKALDEEQRSQIFERIPMKRVGSINEIAATVLFLASDGAGYITGQTIHVNGGLFTT